MSINIRKPGTIGGKALARMMLGLVATSATLSVVAAPGIHPAESTTPAPAQIDQPAGALYGYLWIAGAAFHPFDNSTTYSYSSGGCISKTAGSDSRFTHKVLLPEGSVVRFLRLYYYDDSTSSVTAFFTTYDGAGNFAELTSVGSTNAVGGFGTVLSPLFSYEVNRYTSAISVVANLGNQNNTDLRFCGVRIAYDLPITDRIYANGFDFVPL